MLLRPAERQACVNLILAYPLNSVRVNTVVSPAFSIGFYKYCYRFQVSGSRFQVSGFKLQHL